ncbi:MAG: RsmB/NOP family class I SAM-dependent RNA methyltransferase [Candidatus Aenigmarchaeota archaeon]|nr:RsmB/NOP family class I SAM-dependent RNA methyltransferase [Candidatus Aenigmarchaeota archaeon]
MKNKQPILPAAFKARCSKLLGDENSAFLKCLQRPLRKCIRVNTIKISVSELEKRLPFLDGQFEWYPEGFFINEDKPGKYLEHFLGYYHVQSAMSMVPALILDPKPQDIVLDLTAAPGSKTTQMAQMMENKGAIVANDVRIERLKALKSNIERLGVVNTLVTRVDGRKFRLGGSFDKVLLDAPCSGEGTVRKNWNMLSRWSMEQIRSLSRLQKSLAENALLSLKPGGVMVYSTCTHSPEENEGIVSHLLERFEWLELEGIKVEGIKSREGITQWEGRHFDRRVRDCMRIYPHDNDTEGFFIAKLVRRDV